MNVKCLKLLMLLVVVLAVSAQANLLTNGGFETGDLTGWWTYLPGDPNQTVTIDAGTVYEGSYSAKMWSNTSGNWAELGQAIDIGENVDYTFSLAYNVSSDTNSVGYYLEYQDANWSWLGGEWMGLADTGGSWLTSSMNYTTVAGTAHLIVKLEAGDTTTAYYDDVVLIPEPATIALLALGGLRLLRRRK